MSTWWPWLTLAGLGIYHGINPGMGWLFAVAQGLQEQSRKAVIRAFLPIALGHMASVAVVVAAVVALGNVVSPVVMRYSGGACLIAFGLYKLLAPMSHPRWVGMRVNSRDLALWSFLMATAHGAGLMVAPLFIARPSTAQSAPVTTASSNALPGGIQITLASDRKPQTKTGPKQPSETAQDQTCHDPNAAAASPGDPAMPPEHCKAMASVAKSNITGPGSIVAAISLHTGAMFLAMALIAVLVYEKIGLAILRTAWFNLDRIWAFALMGAGVLTCII